MSLLIWLFSSIFQICNHTGPISHRSCSKVNRICTGLRGKIDSQADWNQHAPNLHHFFGEPVRLRTAFAPKSTGSALVCGAKLILRLTGINMHRICTTSSANRSDSALVLLQSRPNLHWFTGQVCFRGRSKPTCTESAPLLRQSHPVSHHFSRKVVRICTEGPYVRTVPAFQPFFSSGTREPSPRSSLARSSRSFRN